MDIEVKLVYDTDGRKVQGLVIKGGTIEQVRGPLTALAEAMCQPDLFAGAEPEGEVEAHLHPEDRFQARYRLRQ